ncbi:unnamed protein product [Notodromas monacha]|uniref:VASt domain-containing protein n=1 Tax=Notodromas monacha TaxID=399045 RepID=A0A7R9BQ29_9CRUS|nr:unnamed protein product [Notodromas monacha]CAG0919353.1 unnamed protein product [Notodromas monacha]
MMERVAELTNTAASAMPECRNEEDCSQDGWCTPPMNVDSPEICKSIENTLKEEMSSQDPTRSPDVNLDLSDSNSQDSKDIYNLLSGTEITKNAESRRSSSGITPPPPSPMHLPSTSSSSGGSRNLIKEKSSSIEDRTPVFSKRSSNDENVCVIQEPHDGSPLLSNRSPHRSISTPTSSINQGISVSASSTEQKKSVSRNKDLDSVTPPMELTALKGSDSRVSSGVSVGSSVEKKSRKGAWYNRFSASYKTKTESFRRLFNLPNDERLLVDYSCALQRDILLQGRMYISQNYVCFYANIFRWETIVCIRCKDITTVTREKTARVIPNAIQIATTLEKYFFTSFAAREKTYTMIFRVWQNALMEKPMTSQELWNLVHRAYGDELGLTSDDDDYVAPVALEELQALARLEEMRAAEAAAEQLDLKASERQEDFAEIPEDNQDCFEKVAREMGLRGAGGDAESSKKWRTVKWSPESTDGKLMSKQAKKLVRQPISESTDSEGTKSENDTAVISEPVKCTETQGHADKVLVDVLLPVNVDQAFTYLFTSSEFYFDFLASKKTFDIVLGAWEEGAKKGEKERSTSFKVPVVTPMGPRVSHVTQKQTMISCSKPGHLYSINLEVVNGDIPYGDSFYLLLHFCFSKVSVNECRWLITAQIKFRKSVWGFIRGFIEKNSWVGMQEYYEELKMAMLRVCTETRTGIARNRSITKSRLVLAKKTVGSGDGNESGDESASFLRKGSVVSGLGPGLPDRSLEVVPDAEVSTLVARSPDLSPYTAVPSPGFLRVILVVLLSLMVCNVLLFNRLWALERNLTADRTNGVFARFVIPDFCEPLEDSDEVLRLFREQEKSHLEEVAHWRIVISNSAALLKEVEGSLTSLQERLVHHPQKMRRTADRLQWLMANVVEPEISVEDDNESDELR